jgi:hypothetical protein
MICHVINAIIHKLLSCCGMVSHVGDDRPSLYPLAIMFDRYLSCNRVSLCSSWVALQQDVGVTDGHGSLAGSRRVVSPLSVCLSLSPCVKYDGGVHGVCPIEAPSYDVSAIRFRLAQCRGGMHGCH